jgi:hypothetical protein
VLADSNNILNRWKNYFSRLLNMWLEMVGKQKYVQQPSVHEPSPFGVEIAIAEYTSLGSDQIPACDSGRR